MLENDAGKHFGRENRGEIFQEWRWQSGDSAPGAQTFGLTCYAVRPKDYAPPVLPDSGDFRLLHFAPLRGQPRLAPAVDPLLCAPFRSRNSPETGRALRQPAPAPKVATSGLYLRRCNHGQHEDPPTAPTRDVNRDSETDSANGGWLRRLVRHRVNAHKSNSAASNENETDNRQQHKDNANHSQNHRNVKTETAWR